MHRFLIAVLLPIIISGCLTVDLTPEQKAERLDLFSQQWNSFRVIGVLEVRSEGYAFRKDAAIRKNGRRVRLDVFDGGLMGLRPSPWLSAVYDSTLTFRLPPEIDRETFDPVLLEQLLGHTLAGVDRALQTEREQILVAGKIDMGQGTTLQFDRNIRPSHVTFSGQNLVIEFEWNSRGELLEITGRTAHQVLFILTVDEMEYKEVEVPLLKG